MKKIIYYVQSFLKSLAHLFVGLGGLFLAAAFVFWLLHNDVFVVLASVGVVAIVASLVLRICFWVIKKVSSRFLSKEEMNVIITTEKAKHEIVSSKDYQKRIIALFLKIFIFGIMVAAVSLSGVLGTGTGGYLVLVLVSWGPWIALFYFVINFIQITFDFIKSKKSDTNSLSEVEVSADHI